VDTEAEYIAIERGNIEDLGLGSQKLQYPPLIMQFASCHTSNSRRLKAASQLLGSMYNLKTKIF
jgi:hypothetical protein